MRSSSERGLWFFFFVETLHGVVYSFSSMNETMRVVRNRGGFTLVELLVVIAIIGVRVGL